MNSIVTYRATSDCQTHARSETMIRDVRIVIDEPSERGGTNQGPTPTEAAMAALIGCTNVNGHKNAQRLGIDLGDVTIETVCEFDRRGVLMHEEIDVPFPAIVLTVNCATTASQEELDLVGSETTKYCAISKLFKAAGTKLTVNWVKQK